MAYRWDQATAALGDEEEEDARHHARAIPSILRETRNSGLRDFGDSFALTNCDFPTWSRISIAAGREPAQRLCMRVQV